MKGSLHIDGASRGNPGEAGVGFWLEDEEGNILAEVSRYVGVSTNNVAEYMALIWGLEEALALGFDELTVYTDSELVARQIQGSYRVRHEGLKPLHRRAMENFSHFKRWEIVSIPRKDNAKADRLANRAIDG